MSPSRHPMTYYFCNKFVLTEYRAYFFLYRSEFSFPPVVDILRETFDLDDPKIYREVRDKLGVGKVIVGDYIPKTKEVVVQVPLEVSQYTEKRIREVFGQ